jgi:hypothetical protein
MENEYREREEPKVRYEQVGNPMDAVADNGKRRLKSVPSGKPDAATAKPGNEFRAKEPAGKDGLKSGSGDGGIRAKKASKSPKSPKRPNLLVQVLNGDILTRDFVLNNLTFIFFILFLLLLVVGKGYYGKQLTKDIDTLQTEVNATTAEYIENKAKLEESTTRYRLVEMLERRGLKESLKPAKVIRIKRTKNE